MQVGVVKTRLAKTIGDEKALSVYFELVKITQREVRQVDTETAVFYSEKLGLNDGWDANVEKRVQQGVDLGERMKQAFSYALTEKEYTKAVLIGSDCPELSSNIIEEAFEKLDANEVVFGPASDGGYYLVGMKTPHSYLFENMEWSTSSVLEHSLAKLKEFSVKYELLEELSDVDTFEDWQGYRHKIESK